MVAGEASGDMHCARLASKLKELCPSISMFGMGGKLMSQANVHIDYDISDLSVMGITEVLGKLPLLLNRLSGLKTLIEQRKPDAIVLVNIAFMGSIAKETTLNLSITDYNKGLIF